MSGGRAVVVNASIDEAGGVTVHIDSDGDQGDSYSTEVLDDLLKRAAQKAVNIWVTLHRNPADEPGHDHK